MFCQMDPLIVESIVRTEKHHWLLGSLYVCEVVIKVPEDAALSWKADGHTYCIRKSTANNRTASGDSDSERVHQAGTAAAVWRIGGKYIKVKAWKEGMQLECNTIQYVNSISSIPTPEVHFSWVDADWNRSFLVLEAMEGQTLDQAWDLLSADRRVHIADTVAQYCKMLAASTSELLMTADGNGVADPFLRVPPPVSEPSWRPQFLGPYTSNQLQSCIFKSLVFEGDNEKFYFYHADLGPTNILVGEDGSNIGIIDWESAAFYPMFWLGTKPLVSAGFFLRRGERRAWAILLAAALERVGFPSDMQMYRAWEQAVRK